MTPTNKLRFAVRHYPDATIRVLQQWWEDKDSSRLDPAGEWRDVPLEVEE